MATEVGNIPAPTAPKPQAPASQAAPPPPSPPPATPKAPPPPARGFGHASGNADIQPWKKILLDVTPLSLGVATFGDMSYVIIPKNTTVPTKQAKIFTTVKDNQESVRIIITQGESKVSSENVFLGELVLPMPSVTRRGDPQVEVTFSIDTDGLLNVQAKDKKTGKAQAIKIEAQSTLSDQEVKDLSKAYSRMEFEGDSEEVSAAS